MPANLENSAVARGLKKVSFHSNPKERQCQRVFKLLHSSVHSLNVSDFWWPHGLHHTRPPCTNSRSLLKLMFIESVMPSNYLTLCHPLLLPPSIFPSIRVFTNESVLHITWPKYWNFSISPSNEYSGLISFRTDWFDLLAVQVIQESSPTPQFKSTDSSPLSFLYSPTLTSIPDHWKNHSLD